MYCIIYKKLIKKNRKKILLVSFVRNIYAQKSISDC